MIFRAIGQQPDDLVWLREPSEEWDTYPTFVEFSDYVKKKAVVNDPAERMIGLVKGIVEKFRKEENLQAAITTVELVRSVYPKGKKDGKTKTFYTKAELQRIKPSELLAMANEEDEEGEDDEGQEEEQEEQQEQEEREEQQEEQEEEDQEVEPPPETALEM